MCKYKDFPSEKERNRENFPSEKERIRKSFLFGRKVSGKHDQRNVWISCNSPVGNPPTSSPESVPLWPLEKRKRKFVAKNAEKCGHIGGKSVLLHSRYIFLKNEVV